MAEKKVTKQSKEGLIAKAVRVSLSNARRATAQTKKRGEISGGGKKPFRQKGTGRARAGSSRSPIWRGGGIVFGPTGNENYSLSINKKEKRAALTEAYNQKKADVINVPAGKIAKTKDAAELLKKNDVSGKTLVLSEDYGLARYFRNIKDVKFKKQGTESTFDVISARKVVILTGKSKPEGEAK